MVWRKKLVNIEESHSGTFMNQHPFLLHSLINNKTEELFILLSGCFPGDVKDHEAPAGGAVGVCPH